MSNYSGSAALERWGIEKCEVLQHTGKVTKYELWYIQVESKVYSIPGLLETNYR